MISGPGILPMNADSFFAFAEGPAAHPLSVYMESPAAKGLFAYIGGPEAKALQAYMESPMAKALREYMDSPTAKALREYMESPMAKALHAHADSPAAKALGAMSMYARANDAVHGVLGSTTRELARVIRPFQSTFASANEWEVELAKRMTSLGSLRAIETGLTESALGFARLARLSDAAKWGSPYARPVTELFQTELGNSRAGGDGETSERRDAAAIAAGLCSELISFPPPEFPSIVVAAGFRLDAATLPPPQAVESNDPSAAYDAKNAELLNLVEQKLRHLIESQLSAIAGSTWLKRRVPQVMKERWRQRQAEDRDLRRPVYGLIQYADFTDLADIITQANNWEEVFRRYFVNRDDFRVSLVRLHPVRKAIAHGRPLGRADVLTLVAESTRILSAFGGAKLT